MKEDLMF